MAILARSDLAVRVQGASRHPLWGGAVALTLLAMGLHRRGHAIDDRQIDDSGHRRQRGRGRSATTPSDIPARGWRDIALRVYGNIARHRILAIAAGVAFYSILAIFPAIAALVALYGLFADPGRIAAHVEALSGLLPGGAIDVIRDQMMRVASHRDGALGLTFVVGLAIALWSANAGMKAMFDALNVVYVQEESRNFVKLNAVSLAFTTGGVLFIVLALAAVVVLPVVFKFVGLDRMTELIAQVARWPALLLAVTLSLALVYRYGPSRDRPRWRWISWGSVFAALAWMVASMLFSWYAANFGKFNETYGSLGAVIGFMMWLWVSAVVILIGAEVNAEMEHQTARDTTVGHPAPLGRRGATMADTVGAAQH